MLNNISLKTFCYSIVAALSFTSISQANAAINTNLWAIYSDNTRFSPKKSANGYLEFEYMGDIGPVDLYGYFDAPKYFGGSANVLGFWDKDGSKLFMEHEPKLSFNRLTGKDLSVGPFKDWFLAADWIVDLSSSSGSRQNTLYYGVGTSIDTGTKLGVNLNLYKKQQWENYNAANEYTANDGGRLQFQAFYPLHTFKDGATLTYFTFSNYDFGSELQDKTGGDTRTNEAFVSTHVFTYTKQHLKLFTAARYFHNGGQFRDGEITNWGEGDFAQDSKGWGYYVALGYGF